MSAKESVLTRPNLVAAAAAVPDVVSRFTALLRSGIDPDVNAVGHWTVGDVAAHVSHVALIEAAAAAGDIESLDPEMLDVLVGVREISDVGAMNDWALERDPERDLHVLAERIEASAEDLVDAVKSAGEDRLAQWLFGVRLPLSTLCSHFVSELYLHGWDIGRGAGAPWKIDPVHAILSIEGFWCVILDSMGAAAAREFGDITVASCEVRLRGGSRFLLARKHSGAVRVEASGNGADLHISADPPTMLLVMSGRSGRFGPALRGQMFAWGRRPLRAMKMLNGMRAP